MRRYKGNWYLEQKLLFPGGVFLEGRNKETLLEELYRFGMIEKHSHLFWVGVEEERFLKDLCGKAHHLYMSRGTIYKGVTQVTEGPLTGKENRICKIDRHKRLAQIKIMLKPTGKGKWELRYFLAGLEITEKVI